MPLTEGELLAYLQAQGLSYTYTAHPPVYTCEEADQFHPPQPGVHTKNLFLSGGGRFFLATTACAKRLDLKALAQTLDVGKLHFASPEQLWECLGVTPGAVTLLAVIHDTQGQVEVLMDADIWEGQAFFCHPLVNTATLVLPRADLLRFFALTQHPPRVVAMPERGGA